MLRAAARPCCAVMAQQQQQQVAPALRDVMGRIDAALKQAHRQDKVQLVAVSKTKPPQAVQEAYDAGQRVFGENYAQELMEKASQLPDDIRWHFIGHLQSNKAKPLVESVPNLHLVETVDSEKLANRLNSAVEAAGRPPLSVFVQVNSSGEESKFGVQPGQACVSLAQHVHSSCERLQFAGLMTIGMADYTARPQNFKCLMDCRSDVCKELGLQEDQVALSMGMSGDFEDAIMHGSTAVRVGSTIFGARAYTGSKPKDANQQAADDAESRLQ